MERDKENNYMNEEEINLYDDQLRNEDKEGDTRSSVQSCSSNKDDMIEKEQDSMGCLLHEFWEQ